MAKDAWAMYKTFAWGSGEPFWSDSKGNWTGGNVKWKMTADYKQDGGGFWSQGATIVTALDTLYMMNLSSEFKEGSQFIRNNLTLNNSNEVLPLLSRTQLQPS